MSGGVQTELVGVTRRFGRTTALDDVSFTARPGEVLGLLGPNGAGKTTAIRVLVGYLRPHSGSVRVGGLDACADPVGVRSQIGYMPEQARGYPEMKVSSFLDYCARLHRLPRGARGPAVGRAMQTAGLAGTGQQLVGTLSRGYRQRVGLAQALIHDPAVLVLDEPTAGLDPRQRVEVRDLVSRLGRTRTVILSSHLLSEVSDLCRRVVVLDAGRVVAVEELANLTSTPGIRLELRVTADAEGAALVVAKVPGVLRAQVRGLLVVVTGAADLSIEAVSAAVVSAGIGLLELRNTGASLEAAYLRLVQH